MHNIKVVLVSIIIVPLFLSLFCNISRAKLKVILAALSSFRPGASFLATLSAQATVRGASCCYVLVVEIISWSQNSSIHQHSRGVTELK